MKYSALFSFLLLFVITGCKPKPAPETQQPEKPAAPAAMYIKPVMFAGNNGEGEALFLLENSTGKFTQLAAFGKETIVAVEYVTDSVVAVVSAGLAQKKGVFPVQKDVTVSLVTAKGEKKTVKQYPYFIQCKLVRLEQGSIALFANRFKQGSDTKVEQLKVIISRTGDVLTENIKVHDVLATGFPALPKDSFNPVSRGGHKFVQEQNGDVVYRYGKSSVTVGTYKQTLTNVLFSENEEYAVFVTEDVTAGNETLYNPNPETSTLVLYSLKNNKVIREYKGGGYKYAMLSGRHLIFENGFGENSVLITIDLDPNTEMTVKLKKGCGLKRIPYIPDYSA